MTTLLWIESGSCSGESMSILGVDGPNKTNDNILGFIEKYNIELLWHPSLSSESPGEVSKTFDRILAGEQELTLLCVEGSIINGPNGTGMYDTFDGSPKKDLIAALSNKADYVFAMGTCSAFGGIPAAPPNPTESSGLQFTLDRPGGLLGIEWRSKAGLPVINLAGCPVDAAVMIKTMSWALEGLPIDLDSFNKPFSVKPCLSDESTRGCGTGVKVGYSCYGCIGAKFPVNKTLFRQFEHYSYMV